MGQYMTTKEGPMAGNGLLGVAYLPAVDCLSETGRAAFKDILDKNAPHSSMASAAKSYEITRSILEDSADASGTFLTLATQAEVEDVPLGSIPGNFISMRVCCHAPFPEEKCISSLPTQSRSHFWTRTS